MILKRAWLNLRHQQSERAAQFSAGLKRLGYSVEMGLTFDPRDGDLLVSWNRIGDGDRAARIFEARGGAVLVAENSSWGNGLLGRKWLTLARSFHNTAAMFPNFGPERWDGLGVELQPWRSGGETILLPQRGIGPPETAMPRGWLEGAQKRFSGRVRRHPGKSPAKPLADDLACCGQVVTWGSGAAAQALMWGIRVFSDMPSWIADQDNTDAGRLDMFRRLAWAQVEGHEIEDSSAIARLLGR